jgi:hypothetical protein
MKDLEGKKLRKPLVEYSRFPDRDTKPGSLEYKTGPLYNLNLKDTLDPVWPRKAAFVRIRITDLCLLTFKLRTKLLVYDNGKLGYFHQSARCLP